jgi:hypothetical protein
VRPAPRPNFSHLLTMTGPYGTYEHAQHAAARVEHGYCTDDVARVLMVAAREVEPERDVRDLALSSLRFLEQAQSPNGEFRNRRQTSGTWLGPSSSEDCWGRSIWALGTTIARATEAELRSGAVHLFERSVEVRSRFPRSMAMAAIGAFEVLQVDPEHQGARALLTAAGSVLDRPEYSDQWRWSEPRLTYANAVLPEAMLVIGSVLGNDRVMDAGLRQLSWLLQLESREGHLSVTPVGGRGPNSSLRLFDQQPIEVATMSDACVRAFDLTGDAEWMSGCDLTVQWFMGHNDTSSVMFDPETGGSYDGLTADGPNLNQGTESTIALLTTLQHARRLAPAAS